MDKINILVVEDMEDIVDTLYKPNLIEDNLSVDYAKTEIEAKEKINCKTYDIAYVDIMLREDRNDRGGIEVIKYLHELQETTDIIVVSATDDIKVALELYRTGIVGFIQKEEIRSPDIILSYLDKYKSNIKDKDTKYFGRYSVLVAYLANPELTPYWEDKWMRKLGTSFINFSNALKNSLKNKLPILRIKDEIDCLHSLEGRTAYGYFWSKRLGKAIMVSMAFTDDDLPKPNDDTIKIVEEIYKKKFGNMNIAIYTINGMPRSQFYLSVSQDYIK